MERHPAGIRIRSRRVISRREILSSGASEFDLQSKRMCSEQRREDRSERSGDHADPRVRAWAFGRTHLTTPSSFAVHPSKGGEFSLHSRLIPSLWRGAP